MIVAVLVVSLRLVAVVVIVQFLVFGLDQFVGQFSASVVRNVDSRAQRNVISIHWPFVLQHFLRISTGKRLWWRRWSNIGSARLADMNANVNLFNLPISGGSNVSNVRTKSINIVEFTYLGGCCSRLPN